MFALFSWGLMFSAYYCTHSWTGHRCRYFPRRLRNGVDGLGSNFEIEWTPSGGNGTISLDLGTGSSTDINVVMNIATGIPNSGVILLQRSC